MSEKEYLKKASYYSVIYTWAEVSAGWSKVNTGQDGKAEIGA